MADRARTLAALLLALPLFAWAGGDGERRAGDVLSYVLPAATLGAELWRGDRRGAWQFAESFAVTVTATEVLQRTTGIERPDHSNDRSFPSGHAARAFAAATYVHRRYGFDSAWPLYALATYVGYTRVQADRHRWADVAGAAGVAAASSWWLVERKRDEPQAALMLAPHGALLLTWSVPLR
ncbi:MAG TPA: phosphatase PAP2 family protein [Ideonella sp.]|nr:phosphatase PAP2 family protein [Ideonella sp.]